MEAIEWARNYTEVSGDTFELLLHVSQSFLFTNGKTFKKKPDCNNNHSGSGCVSGSNGSRTNNNDSGCVSGSNSSRTQDNFDITMGVYHGAEACELVSLYLLHMLVERGFFPKELVGIYRDDELAVVQMSDKAAEDLKKEVSALFKAKKLELTYEVNTTTTDFLDVKLDLIAGEYSP